jgi:DNA-binding beta-propeller fold protein YncE
VTTYVSSFPFWGLINYVPVVGGGPLSAFTAGPGAGQMVIDPSGQFLFVANKDASTISGYRYSTSPQLIEATTQFTAPFTDGSPYAAQFSPTALAIDPAGSFLYVLCDHKVLVYEVSYWSWGHLKLVATQVLPGAGTGIAAHPSNGAVYVSTQGGLQAYAANPQTGALTTIDIGNQGILGMATSVYAEPSGKWLYVTTPTDIVRFNVAADGTVAAVPFGNTPSNDVSGMTFVTDIQ